MEEPQKTGMKTSLTVGHGVASDLRDIKNAISRRDGHVVPMGDVLAELVQTWRKAQEAA